MIPHPCCQKKSRPYAKAGLAFGPLSVEHLRNGICENKLSPGF